jgi:hypothetical protein
MTLRWVPGWNGLTEPEAVSYVAAVEAADGEPLEFGVAKAINDFVLGCKNDGIWSAIKASCILAGARTLNGALVPLVGAAPTNFNFVAGDYNRSTGLVGDGSTKYLDSNRNNNADPRNNAHMSVYCSVPHTSTGPHIGVGTTNSGSTHINQGGTTLAFRNRSSSTDVINGARLQGFLGMSRALSTSFSARASASTQVYSRTSQVPLNGSIQVFSRTGDSNYGDQRLAFYSIGESLDLAALDTRVSDLITAIGAAIP